MTEFFLSQLEAEAKRTRRAVEAVPEGRDDWKPHDRSMPLGRLANLVATMPSWVAMIVNQDELELNPPGGGHRPETPPASRSSLVQALDGATAEARKALAGTSDDHLMKNWRLLVSGRVVAEDPRYVVLRDTFSHLAHHRAQLGVYLRENGVAVPSAYGPTADDNTFA